MSLKNSCVFVLFLIGNILLAQQTSLVVKSNDSNLLFQASINNILLNQLPTTNLKVTGLKPQGNYFLEVRFDKDTAVFRSKVTIFDVGFYHLYSVNEKGIQLIKIAVDYEENVVNQLVVKFGGQTVDITKMDSVIKSDTVIVDTTEHYQMANYNGKIGCPWPIKDDDFANFKINLNNQRLEYDKLNYCKEYLTNQCLIAKQVAEVLIVFEYEETKLDFAKFIYPRTFDIDNFITEIRPQFKFENSIDQIKQEFKIVK